MQSSGPLPNLEVQAEEQIMQDMMRAVRAHRRGGPRELRAEVVPVPSIAPDEVLVAVYATGITFAELGWDETWTHAPAIPGHEFSGVIVERGNSVTTAELGDAVYGLIRFDRQGAAAEYVAVPAREVARKPGTLTHAQAAALPLAALTAWQGLFDVVKVRSGEHVLVLGGAGGVGPFAVQLANYAGAIVTTTARGRGVDFCLELGAQMVIDSDRDDFAAAGHSFDVVFDTVGGEALARSYDSLLPRGRLLTLQAPPDRQRASQADVEAFFFIVSPDVSELAAIARLADQGSLRVALAASFPLARAVEAFELGASERRAPGKTVLIVRD